MARVLLVEDDIHLRLVTRLVLEQGGHVVDESPDALQALRHLRHERPIKTEVIVADMRMPEMSGLEFVAALRTHDRLSPIPVILLTGDVDARDNAPPEVSVVIKPFEPSQLLEQIIQLTAATDTN